MNEQIDELRRKIRVLDRRIEGKDFHTYDKLHGKYLGQTKDEFQLNLLKMDVELDRISLELERIYNEKAKKFFRKG